MGPIGHLISCKRFFHKQKTFVRFKDLRRVFGKWEGKKRARAMDIGPTRQHPAVGTIVNRRAKTLPQFQRTKIRQKYIQTTLFIKDSAKILETIYSISDNTIHVYTEYKMYLYFGTILDKCYCTIYRRFFYFFF